MIETKCEECGRENVGRLYKLEFPKEFDPEGKGVLFNRKKYVCVECRRKILKMRKLMIANIMPNADD